MREQLHFGSLLELSEESLELVLAGSGGLRASSSLPKHVSQIVFALDSQPM